MKKLLRYVVQANYKFAIQAVYNRLTSMLNKTSTTCKHNLLMHSTGTTIKNWGEGGGGGGGDI